MVAKKTIAATKLNEDDTVLSIQIIDDKAMVVLQTRDGYFLKFEGSEIPEKKKGAVGVRGIKLQKDDVLENVHVYKDGFETKIEYKEKELSLNRLKTAKRDGMGTKQK
jgi:DNA gyrase subunit A